MQFTLSHAFIAVALISTFFGCIAWASLFGAVLFGGACGIALLCVASFKRDGRYVIPGGLLVSLSVGMLVAGSTTAEAFRQEQNGLSETAPSNAITGWE